MKIGFSSFVLQGGHTGIATYIIKLLEALQRVDLSNDYQVFVGEHEEDLLPPPNPKQVHRLSAKALTSPIPNILWHNSLLPYICKKEGLDLVHIPSFRRIPLLKGSKVVATIHDLTTLKMAHKYGWARHMYHHHFLTKLLPRCDEIITVSEYTKRDLIELTGFPEERISTIPSGIDHSTFRPLDREKCRERLDRDFELNGPFMTYISRIEHPAKNHLSLIQAFEQFKARTPNDLKLVLAGAKWNGSEIVHSYAKNSPVSDQIHFLDYVSTDSIVDLYNAAELMIFPSFFEGFGLPLLEAMACGTPVACSNTSAMKEIARGRSLSFDPHDVQAITATMELALGAEFQEKARREGPEHAAHFNWDDSARSVIEVYQKCMR